MDRSTLGASVTPMAGPDQAGPIAGATATLAAWLTTAGVPYRLAGTGQSAIESGTIYVWPLALLPEQEVRDLNGRGPLRMLVRYLLATDGTVDEVTDLLDRVLVAGAVDGPVHLAVEPVPTDTWRGLGLTPRIGLFADVAARVTRVKPEPPRVRGGVRVDSAPLGEVYGQVVGPGAIPIPGIRVVAADSGAATYTDNRGRFRFRALPAGTPARLWLSGKGFERTVEVAVPTVEPAIIHFEIEP